MYTKTRERFSKSNIVAPNVAHVLQSAKVKNIERKTPIFRASSPVIESEYYICTTF